MPGAAADPRLVAPGRFHPDIGAAVRRRRVPARAVSRRRSGVACGGGLAETTGPVVRSVCFVGTGAPCDPKSRTVSASGTGVVKQESRS